MVLKYDITSVLWEKGVYFILWHLILQFIHLYIYEHYTRGKRSHQMITTIFGGGKSKVLTMLCFGVGDE